MNERRLETGDTRHGSREKSIMGLLLLRISKRGFGFLAFWPSEIPFLPLPEELLEVEKWRSGEVNWKAWAGRDGVGG